MKRGKSQRSAATAVATITPIVPAPPEELVSLERPTEPEPVVADAFPLVCVGASAGGLEAFTQLLEQLPADTGMGFVLIQHLDALHPSMLAEVLGKATTMQVTKIADGDCVKRNHVHVIPPGADLTIAGGVLHLTARSTDPRALHLPVDTFLRSLAQERGAQAIAVILSGSASDGTAGMKAIKEHDGITLAQDPSSAKFDGMPRSAVEAGVVDYCLPVRELARELVRLSQHPYLALVGPDSVDQPDDDLKPLYSALKRAVGVDFGEYKPTTVRRRLARRMALRRSTSISDYVALLATDAKEAPLLYEDILIHVTSFFRDPDVFDSLKENVFPEIVRRKAVGDPIRIWVAGCSTGEEVYSLAICLLEFLGDASRSHPIQIFGTDISEQSVAAARIGTYSAHATKALGEERRQQRFTVVENGYRINKPVRDLCVFVRHDLGKDPPFSKLDLVSCRNVLIYFGGELQKRVLPVLHYALNPGGYLVLGRTESLASFGRLFAPIDATRKIFLRSTESSTLRFAPRTERHPSDVARIGAGATTSRPADIDLGKQLDRVLLDRYACPAVLIDERMDVLHVRGDTGAYLRPAPGAAQHNIVKMARSGLVVPLRGAISRVQQTKVALTKRGVEVEAGDSARTCNVVVLPLLDPANKQDHRLVVLFEDAPAAVPPSKRATSKPAGLRERGRVRRLEQELATTEEYLQSLSVEHDRANDELSAVNEELVSGNEELQSMNEELETAKEELQSTNEELITVNDELHNRNEEAARTNSDLANLLATVDVPMLIVDASRRIRRFNAKARSILNILPTDVGRPLDDLRPNLQLSELDEQVAEVIASNKMSESEVQDRSGAWYRMQIRPYVTAEERVGGATLSLIDIDALKHHVSDAQLGKAFAERANRAKDEFLATVSHEIRTPLSSMLMHAQLLARGDMDAAAVIRAGEAIERGTKMQVKLIDDLLDVSRIIAGNLEIEHRRVDLRAVIDEALEELAAPAKRKGVTMVVTLDPAFASVRGDPTRLQQVVVNVLGNAIKFSAEQGTVKIDLDGAGPNARITIADQGCGIGPAFLPHVFSRFTQEDGTTVRRHGGLGLGLSLAHYLIEAHEGSIVAASAGRDKGATFTITLPLLVGEDEADAEVPASEPAAVETPEGVVIAAHASLRGVKILVVDDDHSTREAVATVLRFAGGDVTIAASVSAAMDTFEALRPDVVLTDIAMPEEDGYDLLRLVRARGADGGGEVPVLAMTAFAAEADRARAIAAGFEVHLAKPVGVETLLHAVASAVGRAT